MDYIRKFMRRGAGRGARRGATGRRVDAGGRRVGQRRATPPPVLPERTWRFLIASITTPAWTPLFAMAAAVVTDIGGRLSHSSIAAREYGIPAMLGTGVATRRIRIGELLRIDGDAGTVRLLDGAGGEAAEASPRRSVGDLVTVIRGAHCARARRAPEGPGGHRPGRGDRHRPRQAGQGGGPVVPGLRCGPRCDRAARGLDGAADRDAAHLHRRAAAGPRGGGRRGPAAVRVLDAAPGRSGRHPGRATAMMAGGERGRQAGCA